MRTLLIEKNRADVYWGRAKEGDFISSKQILNFLCLAAWFYLLGGNDLR